MRKPPHVRIRTHMALTPRLLHAQQGTARRPDLSIPPALAVTPKKWYTLPARSLLREHSTGNGDAVCSRKTEPP